MTNKIYRTAMGKAIDLGALTLKNQGVRAVGNMNANSRGDILNSTNQVIDRRGQQVQRQYAKTAGKPQRPGAAPTSSVAARRAAQQAPALDPMQQAAMQDTFADLPEDNDVVNTPEPRVQQSEVKDNFQGGLAAAIARSREVRQELAKPARQQAQQSGVKKI